jgi:hypothetical protein
VKQDLSEERKSIAVFLDKKARSLKRKARGQPNPDSELYAARLFETAAEDVRQSIDLA